MKQFVLFLAALALAGCKAATPPAETQTASETQTPVNVETAPHDPVEASDHTQDSQKPAANLPSARTVDAEGFRPFDSRDISTWGDVIETDEAGNPTQYMRLLPNGDTQTLAFDHGWENKNFLRSEGPSAKYQHWHRPNKDIPIIIIDATTDPIWSGILRDAVQKWNKSEMFNLEIGRLTGEKGTLQARIDLCNSTMNETMKGMIMACNYDFTLNPALNPDNGGYAINMSAPDGHIYSSVMHFNDVHKHFDHSRSEPKDINYTRQFMVCHELGHALGLWHAGEDKATALGTCMDYSRDSYTNRNPNDHDFEELERIYSHSHDTDIARGYVCTKDTDTQTVREYMQRIEFNGMEAIASTTLTSYKNSNRQYRSRQVTISTIHNEMLSYNWKVPDSGQMRQHQNGKTGEFPAMGKADVSVVDMSKYVEGMAVSYNVADQTMTTMIEAIKAFPTLKSDLRRGKLCEVLTREQVQDVTRFQPPRDGAKTGSYKVNEIATNPDGSYISEQGSFVILDDYETTYTYKNERGEAPESNLIDPDIRAVPSSQMQGP